MKPFDGSAKIYALYYVPSHETSLHVFRIPSPRHEIYIYVKNKQQVLEYNIAFANQLAYYLGMLGLLIQPTEDALYTHFLVSVKPFVNAHEPYACAHVLFDTNEGETNL